MEISQEKKPYIWLQIICCRLTYSATSISDESVSRSSTYTDGRPLGLFLHSRQIEKKNKQVIFVGHCLRHVVTLIVF